MKKRLWSLVLCLALLLTVLPVTAGAVQAAPAPLYLCGEPYTKATDQVSYEQDVLTLNGAVLNYDISVPEVNRSQNLPAAIAVLTDKALTLQLVGNNTITVNTSQMDEAFGIFSQAPLTITGDGSLTIQVNTEAVLCSVGLLTPSLKQTSGTVTLTAGAAANGVSAGLLCGSAAVTGGSLTANGGKSAFAAQPEQYRAAPPMFLPGSYGICAIASRSPGLCASSSDGAPAAGLVVSGGSVLAAAGETENCSSSGILASSVDCSGGSVTTAGGKVVLNDLNGDPEFGKILSSGIALAAAEEECRYYESAYSERSSISDAMIVRGGTIKAVGGEIQNACKNAYSPENTAPYYLQQSAVSCGLFSPAFAMLGGTVEAKGGPTDGSYSFGLYSSELLQRSGTLQAVGGQVTAPLKRPEPQLYAVHIYNLTNSSYGIYVGQMAEVGLENAAFFSADDLSAPVLDARGGSTTDTDSYGLYAGEICIGDAVVRAFGGSATKAAAKKGLSSFGIWAEYLRVLPGSARVYAASAQDLTDKITGTGIFAFHGCYLGFPAPAQDALAFHLEKEPEKQLHQWPHISCVGTTFGLQTPDLSITEEVVFAASGKEAVLAFLELEGPTLWAVDKTTTEPDWHTLQFKRHPGPQICSVEDAQPNEKELTTDELAGAQYLMIRPVTSVLAGVDAPSVTVQQGEDLPELTCTITGQDGQPLTPAIFEYTFNRLRTDIVGTQEIIPTVTALDPTCILMEVNPGTLTVEAPEKPEEPGFWLPIFGGGSPFSDVHSGDWFFEPVSALASRHILDGYPDGTFRPQNNVTYGEALKLVLLAANYDYQAPTGSHWASGYQSKALEDGILSGPVHLDAPIDRLAMAHLAAKALDIAPSSDLTAFADCKDGYVEALYELYILKGSFVDGVRVYLPDSHLTRAEFAAIIYRMSR